jgi:CDP-6-deoxy-D-xylo-4-hexulose-3-dehydrase
MKAKYAFYDLGYNLRPTEITGFLGRNQLQYLEENIQVRGRLFKQLEKGLLSNDDFLPLKHDHIEILSPFAFPVVCRTPELFDKYRSIFESREVEIRPIISGNIQNQPFYRKYVQDTYELPNASFLDACGFYFGVYPELSDADIEVLLGCLA